MTDWVLAVDMGGTHIRAAAVSRAGDLVGRRDIATSSLGGAAGIIDGLGTVLEAARSESPESIGAACIGTPGLVDAGAGTVILAPNLPGFRNLQLSVPLTNRLGVPVVIENDANAAALGEVRFGAGRGFRFLLHATLGTGIGGGIVIDGRLYRGSRGLAGEIGHIVLDPAGPVCNCGSRGCLEALVSGVAFANRARRLLASGRTTVLAEVVGGEAPTGAHLFRAAQMGCALSEAEIRNGGHLLGLGLGSLVNVLNPEAVTLSGGLLAMGELLLSPMQHALGSIAYGPTAGIVVRTSSLGDDAGLLGAASVAFERLDSPAA